VIGRTPDVDAAVVRVEPLGANLEVRSGETLAEAAWRLQYGWPTTCWGQAQCTLCWVRVISGEEHVAPPEEEETEALLELLPSSVARRPGVRLACRLKVIGGDVVVEKRGVRPPSGAE
jgi:ferredoxin, 2Fe-2S